MKKFRVVIVDGITKKNGVNVLNYCDYTGIQWDKRSDAEQEAKLARSSGYYTLIENIIA